MKYEKNLITACCHSVLVAIAIWSQQVDYKEYDLDNGLHVILHQDNTAPVVITSVMYHVGGKDRTEGEQALLIFLNTFFSKGPKTLKMENGLKLSPHMEGK